MISFSSQLFKPRTGLTVVAAREHSEAQIRDVIIGGRSSLGATNRTLDIRVTDLELVVVSCQGLQAIGFDLESC